jgi:hypothetical protein
MTAPGPPARPGRAPYVVAAALFSAALLIALILVVIFVRAITGYAITPVEAGEPTRITLGERDVTVWSSPESAPGLCSAVDASGRGATRVSMISTFSVTDRGRTWHRLSTIFGPPGTYTLTCERSSSAEFGYGPSPRIGRYVFLGIVGGGATVALTIASFLILLLTILRRRGRGAAIA